ncbi:MAG: pSer/pThr/pTyr-binding forkhead associated (FHA) protein [Planctomycetaceae bacterium]|jgi:pSer/pThr/pTyr-binding forkhead associated (FHA) protein
MMPRVLLEVISGQSQVSRAVAEPGETIRLGRDALCDLSFPLDTAVSREHCRIEVGDEVISLADSSSYGTTVNGNEVKTVELQHGDQIGLGHGIVVAVIVDEDDDSSSEDGMETIEHASVAYLGPTESLSSLLSDSRLAADPDSPVAYKIDFLSTEREGRVLSFPIDQAVVIGRLSSCDIHIATDPAVSRRHCRIAYEAPDLRLECQGTHGSKINGDAVEAAVVQDGDEIEIGVSTKFRISFVYPGGNQDEGDSFDTDYSVVLNRENTDNGLSICRIETAPEESILTVLAEVLPDHHALMVLDRLKCGVDVEEELETEQYLLCERYPVEVLPGISPILPSPDTWANPEFIQEISGSDAFLLVMSPLDADLEKVIAHLRELTDLNPAHGTYSDGQTLFAYWWPSMIGSVFRSCSSDAAKELIREIDAFAYEVDDGAAVELIALPDFVDQLASVDGIKVRTSKRRKA